MKNLLQVILKANAAWHIRRDGRQLRVVTWNPCRAPSDVKRRSLEGVNYITFSYAGQILLVEEGAAEAYGVNLGEDHLQTNKRAHKHTLASINTAVALVSHGFLRGTQPLFGLIQSKNSLRGNQSSKYELTRAASNRDHEWEQNWSHVHKPQLETGF